MINLKTKKALIIGTGTVFAGAAIGIPVAFILNKEKEAYIEHRFKEMNWTDVVFQENVVDGQYYMTNQLWDKFAERIQNDMNIGPEFNALQKIIIGGPQSTGNNVDAFYNSTTRTMIINITNFTKKVYISDGKNMDEFIEILFQVFFHEYGHHISSSYLNILPEDHPDAYFANDDRWLNGFTKEFKDALNYNNQNPTKVSSETLYTSGDYNIKSIGSKYSAKEIFDFANLGKGETTDKSLELADGNDIYMFLGHKNTERDQLDFTDPNIVNHYTKESFVINTRYKYNYSEIFTRKYLQLKYIYDPSNLNSEFLNQDWGGYHPIEKDGINKNISLNTSISSDRKNYESHNEAGEWEPYLQDAVFNNGSNLELEEIYSNALGYSSNIDLSYIWNNNDVSLKNDGSGVTIGSENKGREIKLAGYLDNNENYTHVSFEKEDGSWEHLEIEVKTHFNGHKDSSEAISYINNDTRKQYWTKEWIHQDNITDKLLYFSNGNDITDTDPITISRKFATTRDNSTVGYVTNNFVGNNWKISSDNLIKASQNADGVKLSKWVYTTANN